MNFTRTVHFNYFLKNKKGLKTFCTHTQPTSATDKWALGQQNNAPVRDRGHTAVDRQLVIADEVSGDGASTYALWTTLHTHLR